MGQILAFTRSTLNESNSSLFDCVDDARPERAISTEWEAAEPVPVDIYHAESRSMVMLCTGI